MLHGDVGIIILDAIHPSAIELSPFTLKLSPPIRYS